MPRQARLDAPGTLHHVIIRGIEKRRIIDNQEDGEDFVSRIGQIALDTGTVIYAWSLMTNHAHILLRSGTSGLSKYMRRLLTGYAIAYNRRHFRHGRLFQNRYTSIVCEENFYFRDLVRYIHLNPLRAKVVEDIFELEQYPWCGHGVLMGRFKNEWQDRDYLLAWFGKIEGEAKKAYRKYVQEGIAQGRRPELVGGGLIRSQGGWSQVISMRRHGGRELSDERILGCGDFVEGVIKEADERLKYQFRENERRQKVEEVIQEVCRKENINIKELRAGSRRRRISLVGLQIASKLLEDYGIPLAEIARQLGVTTSAISKALKKEPEE
jgi:REP element-mobilizing transposase RayT